jgi:hypothetical protein
MLDQANLESDGKLSRDRGEVNEPRPPEHFAGHVELQAFIDATGFAYHWQGTQGFAKKQHQYGDRFIVVPVKTRRGVSMVGLLPPDIVKTEHEAERALVRASKSKFKEQFTELVATIRAANTIEHDFLIVVENAIDVGRALIAAKDQTLPEHWKHFLKHRCKLSEYRAEHYMSLARLMAAPSKRALEIISACQDDPPFLFTLRARSISRLTVTRLTKHRAARGVRKVRGAK